MLEKNLVDVALAVFVLVFLVRGLLRGLGREIASFVGIVGGFAVARHFQHKLQPSLEIALDDPDTAGVIAFVTIMVLVLILVCLVAVGVRKIITVNLAGWIDHLLGGLAGLAKGLAVAALLLFLIQGFFPGTDLVDNARLTPYFNQLADSLRDFLPDAFTYNLPVRL